MAPPDAPASSIRPRGLVLRGRLWTGGERPPAPGIVIIDGTGAVAALGPVTDITVPAELPVHGDDDSWVGPGLVDAHVHLAFGAAGEMVRGGVVAVRDLGAPAPDAARWRRDPSGLVVAAAGPIVTAPGGYPMNGWGADGFGRPIARPDQARELVAEWTRSRSDVVKIALEPAGGQPVPSLAVVRSLVDAAHDAGLAVVAHALTVAMVELALDAGVDELAHTPVEPLPRPLVERIAAADLTVVSTLHALAEYPSSAVRDNAAALVDAGIRFVYGTDLGNSGTRTGAEPRELELLARAGLGPVKALHAATEAAAQVAGLRGRPGLGRLAVGAPAALAVLSSSPLEQPERWRHPRAVVIGQYIWPADPPGPTMPLRGHINSLRQAAIEPVDEPATPRLRGLLATYRADLRVALMVFVASLLVGAVVGVVWEQVATPADEIVTPGRSGGSLFGPDQSQELWTSADGWFALLSAVAGILCAAVAYRRWQSHGVALTIGLVAGGLVGSALASQIGQVLGPDPTSAHLGDPAGTVFTGPLVVHASAVLLVWPIAAAALMMALTAAFGGGGTSAGSAASGPGGRST